MSHKLVSTVPAVYNAQTQASSILTITPQQTSFNDNAGYGGPGMGSSTQLLSLVTFGQTTVWLTNSLSTELTTT